MQLPWHGARKPIPKHDQIAQNLSQAQQIVQTQATTLAVAELFTGMAMVIESIK